MGEPEQTCEEERLAELLAAYDESIARGRIPTHFGKSQIDPQASQRLERETECIRLLERLWPRSSGSGGDKEADCVQSPGSSTSPLDCATRFGRFEVRRPLGYGGYGIVFLAHDPTLRRDVALKVPRPDILITSQLRQRFLREAWAAAALDHPHIVPIYEAGHAGAACYIAEAYCRGPTLAVWLKERGEPLSAQTAAGLVAMLAEGVAHAHARGVLHRDLKPGNILLDMASDGIEAAHCFLGWVPRISDFGLAKLIDDQVDRTQSGVLLGTAGYMAPEQAGASNNEVGAAADIYALGVILYELITGRPPFQGESPLEVLQQVREVEAVRPTRLRGKIPRELETICLKCLEKEPRARYCSAADLAADLRRFLRGEPIHVRRISGAQRLMRWCRRNPALAVATSLAGSTVILLALVLTSFAIQQSRANQRLAEAARQLRREKQEVKASQELAQKQYLLAEQRSALFALDRGLALCEQGEVARGMLWLARSLKIAAALRAEDARDLEQAVRANLGAWRTQLKPLGALFPHAPGIQGLGISPDGRRILTAGWENDVRLWDVSTGEQLEPPLKHNGTLLTAAFNSSGTRVATVGTDGTAQLWETATGSSIGKPFRHPAPVRSVAFSPDDGTIATGSDKGVYLWNASTGALDQGPLPHDAAVTTITFTHDSRLLLTGCWDHKARVWEIETGNLVAVLQHEGPVIATGASPDGCIFLTGSADSTARFWDARTGEPCSPPLRHPDRVHAVAYRDDGGIAVTACDDRKIRFWDPVTAKEIASALPLRAAGHIAAFSAHGRLVLMAGLDESARLWELFPDESNARVLHHPDQVRAVACSPDGRLVLTGCKDGAARLWDMARGTEVGQPLKHGDRVLAVAFSPDGNVLLTGSADATARLWEADTGQPLHQPLVHPSQVNAVTFSPDGQTIVTACDDKTVRFWSAHSGLPLDVPTLRHQSDVQHVVFSSDGATILTGEKANAATLWDVATGAALGAPVYHQGKIMGVALSPDGKTFATASTHMSVRLWDRSTRQPIGQILEHQRTVKDIAFSPDGRLLLTGSYDGTARLWHLATQWPIGPPLTHQGSVSAVTFSPDGRTALTGSWDNSACLWTLAAPVKGSPDWVEHWVELLTGMDLDDDGTVRWLDSQTWLVRRTTRPSSLDNP